MIDKWIALRRVGLADAAVWNPVSNEVHSTSAPGLRSHCDLTVAHVTVKSWPLGRMTPVVRALLEQRPDIRLRGFRIGLVTPTNASPCRTPRSHSWSPRTTALPSTRGAIDALQALQEQRTLLGVHDQHR